GFGRFFLFQEILIIQFDIGFSVGHISTPLLKVGVCAPYNGSRMEAEIDFLYRKSRFYRYCFNPKSCACIRTDPRSGNCRTAVSSPGLQGASAGSASEGHPAGLREAEGAWVSSRPPAASGPVLVGDGGWAGRDGGPLPSPAGRRRC